MISFLKFCKIEIKERTNCFFLKFKFFRSLNYKFNKKYKSYEIFNKFNLNKDSIFLDFGANIGSVTHYINDKYNSYIYSYEPHPKAFSILNNFFKNSQKIYCQNACISNESTLKKFFLHKDSRYNHQISLSRRGSLEISKRDLRSENNLMIKCLSIEDILKQFKFIDCIKIDIEGHEYKILDKIIENRFKIKYVVCELHQNKFYDEDLNNLYQITIDKLYNMRLLNEWFFIWN